MWPDAAGSSQSIDKSKSAIAGHTIQGSTTQVKWKHLFRTETHNVGGAWGPNSYKKQFTRACEA